jgi:hypothetical protein
MPQEQPMAGIERISKSMPSLAHLDSALRSKRWLGKLLRISSPPTSKGRQLADAFVHVVEKSLIEYEAARARLIQFLGSGTAEDYHRAQDHAESCVQSLHRALKLGFRLRSLGFRRADGSAYVPRPRDLPALSDGVRSQVGDLRDALEHVDDDIMSGSHPETIEVSLHLGWDKLSLLSHTLSYAEMASWIAQLHQLATPISEVHITITDENGEVLSRGRG